ncbi:MAG: nicotinate-nucleotide adenylyltransferase [Candidatus Adiutrix sp.]|jgi:nicotinate-nucleotide adenylyltransferase|nr:nicotinate-nucleotide adenylyltransferase [Candidatus Adiutrix sp.]
MPKLFKPGRVGLMGGTFNPVHLGHLRAAEEIAEKLKLEQIFFMPAARPPHKAPTPMAAYRHRLEMLKLAVSDRPGFWASDLESHLPFPSYTVNTVRAFKAEFSPRTALFFLIGLDSFMTIPIWHQYRELFLLASFVVFARAGISETFEGLGEMLQRQVEPKIKWSPRLETFSAPRIKSIHFQPGGRLEISSTDLRNRLLTGDSVRYLVPEPVRIYIETHGLYRHEEDAPEER